MTWPSKSWGGTLESSDGESFDVMVKKSCPTMYMKPATVARAKPCRKSMIHDPLCGGCVEIRITGTSNEGHERCGACTA